VRESKEGAHGGTQGSPVTENIVKAVKAAAA
jgi:hypothetical protein